MTENRKHPRQLVHPSASWSVQGGAAVPARCRDLSLGGCFLECETPQPFGTAVVVLLELPGLLDEKGKPALATIAATVRWTKNAGMGVQFGSMGVRETHALVRVLSGAT